MRDVLFPLIVTALCLTAAPAMAQPSVNLQLDSNSTRILEQELNLTTAEVNQLVEDELLALYGLVDVPSFLRLSANAQSMANKGLGVDYASNVDGWIFGAAVTAALDAGDSTIDDFRAFADGTTERAVPLGAGVQLGLMLGYAIDDDLVVYANGLYYPLDTNDLSGTFYNFGLHVQYKVLTPVGNRAILQWGGLDLSTGLELSRMLLALEDRFEASGTLAPGFDLDSVSTGILELEQRALTIPIEATSNVTLFYFLTLYGGVAVDFQLGEASMTFDLDSALSTADPNVGGELELGSARIEVAEVADPNTVMFRVLGGVQLNIWRLKLFGQLNFLTTDLTLSVAAGLRLVI